MFADGPVVIGPTAPTLSAAHYSAAEAIAGMNAVAGWSGAPRPVSARELLPERALLGEPSAIAALDTEVMRPLADAGPALAETLDAYLDSGGAIEACARKLFVHPNTVRYRLKRIARLHRTRSDHCRAMPTFCGWPRPSVDSVVRRPVREHDKCRVRPS